MRLIRSNDPPNLHREAHRLRCIFNSSLLRPKLRIKFIGKSPGPGFRESAFLIGFRPDVNSAPLVAAWFALQVSESSHNGIQRAARPRTGKIQPRATRDPAGSRLPTDIETGVNGVPTTKEKLHARAIHWDYRRFVYSQTCYKSIPLCGNEAWIDGELGGREREREVAGFPLVSLNLCKYATYSYDTR